MHVLKDSLIDNDTRRVGWYITYFEGRSTPECCWCLSKPCKVQNPFEMLHDVVFHLGVHCLQKCPINELTQKFVCANGYAFC